MFKSITNTNNSIYKLRYRIIDSFLGEFDIDVGDAGGIALIVNELSNIYIEEKQPVIKNIALLYFYYYSYFDYSARTIQRWLANDKQQLELLGNKLNYNCIVRQLNQLNYSKSKIKFHYV